MNKKNKKILIMSAPIGSGHTLAALALKEEFEKNSNCEVVMGNAFDFIPGFFGKFILQTYLFVLKHCPFLYKYAYQWGNKETGSLWLRNFINGTMAWLAEGYLKKLAPDCVIATHATPAGIISSYKARHPELKITLVSIVTDFSIHRWWVCQGTDAYFLAADDLASIDTLKTTNIYAYGIPVRTAFRRQYDRLLLRKHFAWPNNIKVCLLMGGGEGLLAMQDILLAAQKNVLTNIHFVAITGRNTELAKELKKDFPQLEVYGFTDAIPELMHAADIIVTKAGGLTAAETITTNLQYIIYGPLPGQEEGNAAYLVHKRLAAVAHTPTELFAELKKNSIFVEPQILKTQRANATVNICAKILELL
ncbi:MAG TPA: hypothetical protein IAB06_06750 [Candidatus Avacidaminococcus intestinavium]|uniref:Monogalactosyldiacylglycerol synthase n=1 Tax=Candidatus Avacidaminococcus intestinavium TaxID=2840684 RepID=A0A9D1MR10_9FIRM|nr:hypothetical protein [Candidatus Avacidaminococcus intestinavium]